MKEKNKKDIVKIKGILGLFLAVFSLVYMKIISVYNLHQDYKIFIGFILFIVLIISVFLSQPYINRLITGCPARSARTTSPLKNE